MQLKNPIHLVVIFLTLLILEAIPLVVVLNNKPEDAQTQTHAASMVQASSSPIKTVFLILMENHDWSQIKGTATYITNTLLPMGAHAENYHNVSSGTLHPSEPNYITLEAGTNALPDHAFTTDADPGSANSSSSTSHLVSELSAAGIPWKAYQEDISGSGCPISSSGGFAPKHLGALFFQDVVGNPPNASNMTCATHVRPYTELAADLAANKVSGYNFITPNLTDDMHNGSVQQGDQWLATELPKIMASQAYQNGGAIFITWDEGSGSGNNPIGMIVLSPLAKKNYQNTIAYSHASMLKTAAEIFGVSPAMGNASSATDLSDLFTVSVTGGGTPPTQGTPSPTVFNGVPSPACIGQGICATQPPTGGPAMQPNTSAAPSGTQQNPSQSVTSQAPVQPSQSPCQSGTVAVTAAHRRPSRHHHRNNGRGNRNNGGNTNGLIGQILQLLRQLLNLILKLLGQSPVPSNPSPTPTPCPPIVPLPSQGAALSPTVFGQPSSVPLSATPTSGQTLAPSGTKQTITAYGWGGSAAYQPSGSPWWTLNDAWGGPPPNTQAIDYYPNTFPNNTTLRWTYGGSGGNVLGYPEIVIGDQNGQTAKSPNGVEPAWYGKTLGSLSHFILSWDITINTQNGDNWDILFENHMSGHETGIFLKDPGWVTSGTHFSSLGGISGIGRPNCWASGSFCIVPDGPLNGTPMLKGSVDLLPIFKWAIANGWMSSSEPVYGWEFGVEPTNGSGSVTFNSLSVDIK